MESRHHSVMENMLNTLRCTENMLNSVTSDVRETVSARLDIANNNNNNPILDKSGVKREMSQSPSEGAKSEEKSGSVPDVSPYPR